MGLAATLSELSEWTLKYFMSSAPVQNDSLESIFS